MRVTFVLPYAELGGGTRVLATYARRLHQRGNQVNVVSLPARKISLGTKLKSLVRGNGWPHDFQKGPSFFDGAAFPHRVLETVRPVVDDDVPDADIILATFWKTGPWVAALSARKGVKAILLQGYETSPGHEDPAIDAVWRLPLHKIVISRWLVDLARDRFGDTNVHHVPNSVDTDQFHAAPRGKQAQPTVGLLYSTVHLKGLDISLAALRLVREKLKSLRVVAFGAVQVSPMLPLPEWVDFRYRPKQEQLRDLYAQCDVWLCGSRREGFHLPPLEAMACRCPVVSTRVGGPMDIVEEGVNGHLVDVEDAYALADRLLRVLTASETEWMKMSDAALATATRYSWDDATDRLENALRELIEQKKERDYAEQRL